ncbi:protein of unknown function [Xenorhabdus poinarii G6]|uniref:Uncharacterized protein n=1 Tax=Xenorhabdus poinarii G6 TaxID=1354304 RepID=A0A068R756_9GAMM|nr:protein of unknown function [Xenorhabdus poinarii G6]
MLIVFGVYFDAIAISCEQRLLHEKL